VRGIVKDDPSEKGPGEILRAKLNQRRIDSLKNEFAMCTTLALVAATKTTLGERKAADKAIADAEKGYGTISRLLSDPKIFTHLTSDLIQEFTAELQRLRDRLDGVQGRRSFKA
jgi:hypothetical protein